MKRMGYLLILGVMALAQPVLAQATDDATRSAARDLGYQGVEAYQAGDYANAVDKLERAFAVAKVPTLGLWLARALVKTGKLVEASERYGEVMRSEVAGGQVAAQKQAQSEAAAERVALAPRIPSVRIDVKGANPSEVRVTVDGAPVPTALLGASRPVNPGARKIAAQRGEQVVSQEVALAEGESKGVVLDFAAAKSEPSAAQAPPVARGPEPAPLPAEQPRKTGGAQRTVGWVGVGIGGAGLVVGGVTGLLALTKRNSSSSACPQDVCPPQEWDRADSVNSLRTVSTVSFIVGAVGLGAGITLLLTAPKERVATPAVTPWVGVGSLGLLGRY